jgi:hypothetical protein
MSETVGASAPDEELHRLKPIKIRTFGSRVVYVRYQRV